MNIWGILGIGPTGDVTTIKKAYAQKLKIYHPEDDPQGFQQLREAYDSALKYAKKTARSETSEPGEVSTGNCFHAESSEAVDEESPFNDVDPQPGIDLFAAAADRAEPAADIETAIVEVQARATALYDDFFARLEPANWQALFDDELLWNIEYREKLAVAMLDFITEHYHLPQSVWLVLNQHFNWSSRLDSYSYRISEGLREYILGEIAGPATLDYTKFNRTVDFDYDQFIDARERILAAYAQGQFPEIIEEYLALAAVVYPDEPRMAAVGGEFYFRMKEFEKAKNYLEKAVRLYPTNDHLLSLLEQANRKIKLRLGWEWLKKPWRSDLGKRYYELRAEIRKLKMTRVTSQSKMMLEALTPYSFWIFLMGMFILIFGSYLLGNLVKGEDVGPAAAVKFTELTVAGLGQTVQGQKIHVKFEREIRLDIMGYDLPGIENVPLAPEDKQELFTQGTSLTVGQLGDKEVLFYARTMLVDKYFDFNGVIYNLDSPELRTVITESLVRMNAPDDVIRNLVPNKLVVSRENDLESN
jgi:tetratricopeptide (TPR) repeat protein